MKRWGRRSFRGPFKHIEWHGFGGSAAHQDSKCLLIHCRHVMKVNERAQQKNSNFQQIYMQRMIFGIIRVLQNLKSKRAFSRSDHSFYQNKICFFQCQTFFKFYELFLKESGVENPFMGTF